MHTNPADKPRSGSKECASPARIAPLDLFIEFTRLTLHSFGGALFWSRRMLVERRRWLTEQEFVELLALAQLLPGANGLNLAGLVGYRFAGLKGALAAMTGFIGAPVLVILAIGALYQHYGAIAPVRDALTGMSSVAVGLLIATAAKMVFVLQRRWLPWTFAVLTFVAVGTLRWPLLAVVAALAPLAIAATWRGKH
jgi:chromate transporter